MKKVLCLFLILFAFHAFAEEMIVPSSFDERKMILKRKDENGNFVPVDESKQILNQSVSAIPEPTKTTKRFRKLQKEYGIPKSTINVQQDTNALPSSFQNTTFTVQPENSSFDQFSNQTMLATKREWEKDNTIFEECKANDKGCQEYEVDTFGKVKF